MRFPHTILARVAPVVILSLALSGCGGSNASPSPPTGAVGATAPAAAAPTTAAAAAAPTVAVAVEPIRVTTAPAAEATAAPAAAQATTAPAAADVAAGVAPAATTIVELPEATPAGQVAVEQPPIEVNPFTSTTDDKLSTFALDVDTASYAAARNYLLSGTLPPADTVRVEEFVNYFDYNYPEPQAGAFGITVDAANSPWSEGRTKLVRVGIQGKHIDSAQRQDAVLTFVIDVSGSMQASNRLPLVKETLTLLVDELRASDQVALVVYGSVARTVLEPTSADQKQTILNAINSLGDEGSTNAEAGLKLGYQVAGDHLKQGAINRVILCSDGVANVGATGPDAIRQTIRDYTAQGVYLTTVGFGMGDYNDNLMEQLADDGNGNYAYVDTIDEARRVFVENLTGTLQVIAKDAKVQVEFDPAIVSEYRLLGYENRAVADQSFRDDKVDAGEIGAGHSVTALYEVVLTEQGQGDALNVQMRWADPQTSEVTEISQRLNSKAISGDFAAMPPRFQQAVAVAAFAEHLRDSAYAQNRPLSAIAAIIERIAPQLANDASVTELLQLVRHAEAFE